MIVKRLNHFTELSHKSDSKGVTVVTVLYNFTMDTITFTQTCLTFPKFIFKNNLLFLNLNEQPLLNNQHSRYYSKNIESTYRVVQLS